MATLNNDYICPICGFVLDFKPWSDNSPSEEICPSCGMQFGYDDAAGGNKEKRLEIYKSWRKKWIKEGMKWWSEGQSHPENWNPNEQLKNIPEEFQ